MNNDWISRIETERFDHPIQHEVMRIHAERVRRFYHPTLAETIGKSSAEREEQRAVREAQEANALEFVKSQPDGDAVIAITAYRARKRRAS